MTAIISLTGFEMARLLAWPGYLPITLIEEQEGSKHSGEYMAVA